MAGEQAGLLVRLSLWWRASLIREIFTHGRKVEFGMKALALTAEQALSAAPALIAAAAIVKQVRGADLVALLSELFGLHGEALREVQRLFRVTGHVSLSNQFYGLLVAALFATSAAGTMQALFEQIWGLPRASWRTYWRYLVWVACLIPFFTVSIRVANVTKDVTISPFVDAATAPLALGVASTLFYWWTQRLLLCGRIRWKALFPGSLLIGIGMIALSLVGQQVGNTEISEAVSQYGLVAAGFVFILLLWLVSLIVLSGALIGSVLHHRHIRHA